MDNPTSDHHYLTIAQASQFLGVSPSTIRRWARDGVLSGVKIGSRGDWRFTHEHLSQVITLASSNQLTQNNGLSTSSMVTSNQATPRSGKANNRPSAKEPDRYALQRLELAQKAGHIGTFDWDFATNTIVFTHQAEAIFGYKPGTLVGNYETAAALIHPDDRAMARELSQKAINGSGELDIEYRIVRPNKTVAWVNIKGLVIKDDNQQLQKLLGIVIDITEHKQADEALRQSETRYRQLVEAAPVGIAVHDGHKLLYVNQACSKMIGAESAEQLIGQPIIRFIHPDSIPLIEERRRMLLSTGVPNPMIEEKYLRLDGSVIDVEVISIPAVYQGQPAVQVVINDITERKSSDIALEAARAEVDQRQRLYEAVTDSTLDLIYVFDLHYRFTYANEALLKMWGKSWEESIGHGLRELGYEEWHAKMHEQEIDQVVATGQPIRGEVDFPHATLGKRNYDYIFTPVFDAQGQVVAVAGTTRDITEIKQLSKQKDEFIGVASHELKTPVTSIKAYAQALENRFRKKGDLKTAQQLAKIDTQLNKLTNLIGDLLDVTKIESGQMEFSQKHFNLDELIKDVVEELQSTTDRHQIIIEGSTAVTVWGDPDRLSQVLSNLLSNAIKYSPAADKIKLIVEASQRYVTLAVQDYGVGLAKDKHHRVFERFYRVSGPKQDTFPGLGLGLFISSEIVKRLGGRIWVESAEGQGATFYVRLPIKPKNSPLVIQK